MCSGKHLRHLHCKHYPISPQFWSIEEIDVKQSIDGSLAYLASSAFYAAAIPAGAVQQKVYIAADATNTVEVSFVWQSA